VFGGFSAVALAIAAVGVAGVLAFSVSGRTREFGVRLAIGSHPGHLLAGVLAEGTMMASVGIVVGAAVGFGLGRLAASYIQDVEVPGFLPALGAAAVLLVSAVVASALPAIRAARVDVLQALRAE
jgi:ABC-type antimicrobial peptide transport system permease subunit